MSTTPLSDLQQRVIWYLRKVRRASRIEIASALDLTNSKMTSLSKELTSLRLIEESSVSETLVSRGRPMIPLQVSPKGGYAIGATVHPGWLEIAVVDFSGQLNHYKAYPFTSRNPAEFIRVVNDFIRNFSREFGLSQSRFLGIGIAVAGHSDISNLDHVRAAPWLEEWRGINLREFFSAELGHPVWVENDVACAALAELYCGEHFKHSDTGVVLYLGHGIGGGVVTNHGLYRGSFGNAGEPGMLVPAAIYPKRPSGIDLINELKTAGADVQSLYMIEQILDEFPHIEEQWTTRVATQLELIILSAIVWLDPGVIVLSGALPHRVIVAIKQKLDASSRWIKDHPYKPHGTLELSELGSRSVVWGAGLLPIDSFRNPRTRKY